MATLNFVPVEKIALRELELIQIVLLDEGQANAVQGGEQPAATGVLLICHRFALGFNLYNRKETMILKYLVGMDARKNALPCRCKHAAYSPTPSSTSTHRRGRRASKRSAPGHFSRIYRNRRAISSAFHQ